MMVGCAVVMVGFGGHARTVPGTEMISVPSGDHSNAAPSLTGVGPSERASPPSADTTPIGLIWAFVPAHRSNAICRESGDHRRSVPYQEPAFVVSWWGS